jgi:hypothetical protein
MPISHADHDHPNTPAARAACRKSMAATGATVPRKPAQVTVVPRTRGDGGVVRGLVATTPTAAVRRLKVSGTLIKRVGDLADVPADLATEVRRAWKLDWTVQVGHPFNDDERRIVITGPKAEIALVWDSKGRTATFVRHHDSSVTSRVGTPDDAFDAADTDDAWDGHGNYVGL